MKIHVHSEQFDRWLHAACGSIDEADRNLAVMAEALNVHHEIGLTPRELVEQRNMLLGAARITVAALGGGYPVPELIAAIARAEGRG